MVASRIHGSRDIYGCDVASVHDRKSDGVDMMGITEETRLEGYILRPVKRCDEILEFMGDRELTARQIAYGMGYSDLNAVKPRITELKKAGKVEAVGKTKDDLTGRNVAVYRAAGGKDD